MAGWTFMPINRVMTCDGTSLITLAAGTAVAGYGLVNLNDPDGALVNKVTPTLGAITYAFDFNHTASFSTDPTREISGIGLHNFNGAGATFQLYSHSSAVFGSATSRWGPYTLTSGTGYVDLFDTFTPNYARYWWLTITGAPSTFQVGVIGLGPTMDFGYPQRPAGFNAEGIARPTETAGGRLLPTIANEPRDVKNLFFPMPTYLTKNLVYDKSSDTVFGAARNTVWRAFRHRRQHDPVNNAYTGLAGGSGAPMFYHEGDNRGRSDAGRPGFYGFCELLGIGEDQSADRSTIRMRITEADPKSLDVQPAV